MMMQSSFLNRKLQREKTELSSSRSICDKRKRKTKDRALCSHISARIFCTLLKKVKGTLENYNIAQSLVNFRYMYLPS